MILLREAELKDVEGLESLSKIAAEFHQGFLNLAHDKDQWKDKIRQSIDSFAGQVKTKPDSKFIFIAEDTTANKVVGMSMVTAQHGTPEVPHFYFELGSEQKFSSTISTGFIHGTLFLKHDVDGPTEVGGLLVDPDYRKHSSKVGKQISLVRFLYIAINRAKFKDEILAELLPPLTKKGKASLWEALGRRFTNLDYPEADELSSKNKEFILSLFPAEKIYVTFLPADARNAIGKVSKDTEPVLHMLKKIGFKYNNEVDPFDGGPHLRAQTDQVLPIRSTNKFIYSNETLVSKNKVSGLITMAFENTTQKFTKKFAALSTEAGLDSGKIYFDPAVAAEIETKFAVVPGQEIWFMPYY